MGTGRFLRHRLSDWKAQGIIWLAAVRTIITALFIHWGDDVLGVIMASAGMICVILARKGKTSRYPFGLVNTVLYAWIVPGARHYGEVMLSTCHYVPMQFVRWFMWKRRMDGKTKEVERTRSTVSKQILFLVLSAVFICGYGLTLKQLGGNLPFTDSMSTCLSMLTTLLSVKCLTEQWIIWIVVDVVTVLVWFADYQEGGADITTLLIWCIYLLNAMFMFVRWFRESGEHVNEV